MTTTGTAACRSSAGWCRKWRRFVGRGGRAEFCGVGGWGTRARRGGAVVAIGDGEGRGGHRLSAVAVATASASATAANTATASATAGSGGSRGPAGRWGIPHQTACLGGSVCGRWTQRFGSGGVSGHNGTGGKGPRLAMPRRLVERRRGRLVARRNRRHSATSRRRSHRHAAAARRPGGGIGASGACIGDSGRRSRGGSTPHPVPYRRQHRRRHARHPQPTAAPPRPARCRAPSQLRRRLPRPPAAQWSQTPRRRETKLWLT